MKKLLITSIIIIIMLTIISCAAKRMKPKYEGYTDQQLYDKGIELMNKKKWDKARDLLKYLIENFYQSKLIMDAKLALADSYYKQGGIENYIVAVQQYEEFIKFYPSSVKADYAQFQIGICYYNQMNKPGRDQTNTYNSINALKKLIENYPRSSYIQAAKDYLIKAYINLNNHQLAIIRFYLKHKKWDATINRFEEMLNNSPKESITAEIYYYYAKTLQKVGRQEDSKIYSMLLIEKFPTSKYSIAIKANMDRAK